MDRTIREEYRKYLKRARDRLDAVESGLLDVPDDVLDRPICGGLSVSGQSVYIYIDPEHDQSIVTDFLEATDLDRLMSGQSRNSISFDFEFDGINVRVIRPRPPKDRVPCKKYRVTQIVELCGESPEDYGYESIEEVVDEQA